MATIHYCKICEDLIVDEDELPIVGDFCSRKCEKLFDKHGLQGGKKEYKKKGSNSQVVVPVKNLPSESIPESIESTKLNKKKPIDDKNVVFKNINSFFTRIDKDKSSNKQRDYDDSLEYFRKQSEIEHSMRDIPDLDNSNNTINKPKEQLNRPSSSRVENHGMEIPPPRVDDQRTLTPTPPSRQRTPTPTPPSRQRTPTPTPPSRQRTPTPTPPHVDDQIQVESQTTSPSLYPDLKQNRPPLEDFDHLVINDDVDEPPPPSYDTLFPVPPLQTVNVEKPLPPQPTENKPIINDQKEPIVVTDKKDPVITDKKETTTNTTSTPPIIPPKVPPKVSIPTANRDSIPPQPQTRPYSNYSNQFTPNNFSSDSNSYQQYHQVQFQLRQFQQPPHLQQYQQYQQSQDNTADTFLQEQAFLPSTVYPPPFYTTRFNKNNNA